MVYRTIAEEWKFVEHLLRIYCVIITIYQFYMITVWPTRLADVDCPLALCLAVYLTSFN